MICDLHIYTTCSNVAYSKLQLLKRMNEKEFEVVSFTDHNYVEVISIGKIKSIICNLVDRGIDDVKVNNIDTNIPE